MDRNTATTGNLLSNAFVTESKPVSASQQLFDAFQSSAQGVPNASSQQNSFKSDIMSLYATSIPTSTQLPTPVQSNSFGVTKFPVAGPVKSLQPSFAAFDSFKPQSTTVVNSTTTSLLGDLMFPTPTPTPTPTSYSSNLAIERSLPLTGKTHSSTNGHVNSPVNDLLGDLNSISFNQPISSISSSSSNPSNPPTNVFAFPSSVDSKIPSSKPRNNIPDIKLGQPTSNPFADFNPPDEWSAFQ